MRSSRQTGRGVDFYEPRFASIIYKHIKPIELEAVFIVNDNRLHTLQRHDY